MVLLKSARQIKRVFGKVHVNFGEPLPLAEFLEHSRPGLTGEDLTMPTAGRARSRRAPRLSCAPDQPRSSSIRFQSRRPGASVDQVRGGRLFAGTPARLTGIRSHSWRFCSCSSVAKIVLRFFVLNLFDVRVQRHMAGLSFPAHGFPPAYGLIRLLRVTTYSAAQAACDSAPRKTFREVGARHPGWMTLL